MISPPAVPQPPTPPNPPMFGGQNFTGTAKRQKDLADRQGGFGSTVVGQANPTNTGQKTLLGQ